MSDLCMYELEDNVWDEFGESDDHIVPHPTDEYRHQYAVQPDSRKKRRHDMIDITSNADNSKYIIQGKEEKRFPSTIKEDTMLEKESWAHTPDSMFPVPCDGDSVKDMKSISSEDSRMSNNGFKSGNMDSIGTEFCTDNPILGGGSTATGSDLFPYPLNHISQTESDLSFFDNGREDKESSDLFYGWPDIENFEDVDRMFRSCDSTFGLGSLSNEENLCWFPSSHTAEDSEDALTSNSKLTSISEHQEPARPNNQGSSTDDSCKRNAIMKDKMTGDVALDYLSSMNMANAKSVDKNELILIEQPKYMNQSEGKRKGRPLENGGSFNHTDNLKQKADVKNLFGDSSCQAFSSPAFQLLKENAGPDSLNYMHMHVPYPHLNYGHSSEQMPISPIITGKSGENVYPSSSPNESSYASNQAQATDSIPGPVVEANATPASEKGRKAHKCQDLQVSFVRNINHPNMQKMVGFSDPVSIQKQVNLSETEVDGRNEVDGDGLGMDAELESSYTQGGSCVSSVLDEISLEATSFRQLQHVMEQLDLRTKLCIRDSLYRLARSAEQRHNWMNLSGNAGDDRDVNQSPTTEEKSNCAGFMDIETDTNPIDRSIAHLLFHRPSDPSMMPVNDSLSLKSQAMIHGPTIIPPVMAEEQEETVTGRDKKMLTSNDKY
ncbi:protein LNK1 isoform X3 [Carica papaya]|uniref:protein LNK1 isoform X3 n=1 Tax=Carica papaya TaxID=3649 RepID=UPI000B8CE31C|nr:protein LNK1 isoform X3 [Carica papaya]